MTADRERLPFLPDTPGESMQCRIRRKLDSIEAEHGVRILYACESGSRAWGMASADSDCDVRFVYARPAEQYLCVDPDHEPDVIECGVIETPDGLLDCNGWDVHGHFMEWDYDITCAGRTVATVSKEIFNWTDTYIIDKTDPTDALCALMLVLAIDAEKCSNN